jgi:non-heme Fe2+,alpha-ketoglutarate-dependent halogenase
LPREILDLEKFGKSYKNTLKTGDFSLHADMLAHGSLPNTSNQRRCGLTIRYCDPSATKPLEPAYAQKAILCRGEKPMELWKDCKTEKPEQDDLSVIESNPGFEIQGRSSKFH